MVECLTLEAIEQAQKRYAPADEPKAPAKPSNGFFLDVQAYLAKYSHEVVKTKTNGSSTLYCLKHCIFNPSHNGNEAAIGQTAEGKLFYQCFHNSCQGKTWHEARQIISGDDRLFEGNSTATLSQLSEIDEERRAIQEESREAESKIQAVCIESIAEAEIEDRPIIEGLLDENESLIVSAASGAGKSLFMNYLAMALGNPPQNGLWGLFPIPNMVKSLIVQSENSFKAFNKRLNKIFNACPEMKAGAKNVFILKVGNDCRLAGSLTDKEFQKVLIDNLLSVEAGNLILDPLISYHGEDENDNAAMRRSLDCLSLICDQAGVSVMICHHYNRQNLTRGAASIRDWASNMLLMDFEKKSGDSVILKITHDKSRNYEQQPDFFLERTPDLQFLRCEKPGKQSKQVDAVINELTKLGGYVESATPLKNAVMTELNCSEATARRAINEAMKIKKIIIIPGNKKGEPNAYELPDSQT